MKKLIESMLKKTRIFKHITKDGETICVGYVVYYIRCIVIGVLYWGSVIMVMFAPYVMIVLLLVAFLSKASEILSRK